VKFILPVPLKQGWGVLVHFVSYKVTQGILEGSEKVLWWWIVVSVEVSKMIDGSLDGIIVSMSHTVRGVPHPPTPMVWLWSAVLVVVLEPMALAQSIVHIVLQPRRRRMSLPYNGSTGCLLRITMHSLLSKKVDVLFVFAGQGKEGSVWTTTTRPARYEDSCAASVILT